MLATSIKHKNKPHKTKVLGAALTCSEVSELDFGFIGCFQLVDDGFFNDLLFTWGIC